MNTFLGRPRLDLSRSREVGCGRGLLTVLGSVLLLSVVVPFVVFGNAGAARLSFRQLQLSDSTISATGAKYDFRFNTNTSGPIGSVRIEVCANYRHESSDPCTPPVGFDASAAALTAQTGITDFALNPASNDHLIILSRPASVAATPQQLTLQFSNITNPSIVGSNYARITTHIATDASDAETDDGVVAFATNEGIGITTEVPPFLLFCTGVTIDGYNCRTSEGSFINFGELSSKVPRAATSQLLASTNAPYGYSVTLAGSTMTAGNNVIPAMTGNLSQTGISQFGLNSRSNGLPFIGSDPEGPGLTTPSAGYNTPNLYKFGNGDIVASSNDVDDYRKLTMSYIVNVGTDQPPGRYVATISYICLANF